MTPRAVQQLERWMTPRHPIKERLMARIDGHRQSLLEGVQRARDELLADLLASAGMRDATAVMARIADQVGVYARSCDWALLDLIVLASCVRVDPRALARDLAPPLLIYQAYRMVDDVLDDHDDYHGGDATCLGVLRQHPDTAEAAPAVNLLIGLMMVLAASRSLDADTRRMAMRTITGALEESLPRLDVTEEDYRRIVTGKMVAYGMVLHGPVTRHIPRAERSAVDRFLRRSFFLSQMANDLADQAGDASRGQINYWNLCPEPAQAEADFMGKCGQLVMLADGLPADFSDYGQARLCDLFEYISRPPR